VPGVLYQGSRPRSRLECDGFAAHRASQKASQGTACCSNDVGGGSTVAAVVVVRRYWQQGETYDVAQQVYCRNAIEGCQSHYHQKGSDILYVHRTTPCPDSLGTFVSTSGVDACVV
jgi:hypothetical protein